MLQKFLKYELQSVAGMVGISIYILADTFFISVYSGADGLAMLNLVLPVYGVIYAIGSMIGIGSATRYGINKAKGEETDYYFLQAIFWNVLFSIPFVLTGLFMPQRFLGILGADAKLTALGTDYLKIFMTAAPLFMSNYTFTAFARNDHATSVVMTASIAGSLFNIVFDYIFMFPLGLGLSGAALATAVSPGVTIAVCSTHYLGKKNTVGFRFKTPSFHHLISCCKLGISAFVGEISSAVITVIFNMLILGIAGNIGVAAYGVIANMSAVAMSIFNGLAQGVQPLISESYGKSCGVQVKKLLRAGLLACLLVEILIVAGVWGQTDGLIAVFNSEHNAALLSYAHIGLRLYFLGFLFAGINIMLVAYFSAVDDAKTAIIGSVMRGAVAIAACAVVFSRLFGINGVWISFLGSEMITCAVICGLAYRKARQRGQEK